MAIALVRAKKGKLFTITGGTRSSLENSLGQMITARGIPLEISRMIDAPDDMARLVISTAESRLNKQYVPENNRAWPRWWKVDPDIGETILGNSYDAVTQGGFFAVSSRAKMRAVREMLGVNVSTFAAILGCSVAQASRLESDNYAEGRYVPSYEQIGRIRAFCTFAYIPLNDDLLY